MKNRRKTYIDGRRQGSRRYAARSSGMRSGFAGNDSRVLRKMDSSRKAQSRLRSLARRLQREKRSYRGEKLRTYCEGLPLRAGRSPQNGKFPCIIHWNFNHFLVLDGFKGNKAYLNDPAKGSYSVSMEDFDKAFTGICLMFEPTEDFVPEGKPRSVLSFAKEKLKGSVGAFVFTLLTTVILSLTGLIDPIFRESFSTVY